METFKIIWWIVVCFICCIAQNTKKDELRIFLLGLAIEIVGVPVFIFF